MAETQALAIHSGKHVIEVNKHARTLPLLASQSGELGAKVSASVNLERRRKYDGSLLNVSLLK